MFFIIRLIVLFCFQSGCVFIDNYRPGGAFYTSFLLLITLSSRLLHRHLNTFYICFG